MDEGRLIDLEDVGEEQDLEQEQGRPRAAAAQPAAEVNDVARAAPPHAFANIQQPWYQYWAQHPPPPPPPPRITLTPFWTRDPMAWFRLAEANFHRQGVTDSNLKFDLVLPALPEEAVEQIRHVLRDSHTFVDPYDVLKTELVRQYTPNVLEQLNGILFAPELGGQSPSQLMNKLLALLPATEPPGLLFKQIFILRLPLDIQDQVAKKIEQVEPRELAAYADTRWYVRNAKKPAVAAAVQSAEEAIEELTGTLAAMPSSGRGKHKRGPRGRGSRGGRGGRGGGAAKQPAGDRSVYICLRHCQYGDGAFHCDDPSNCKYQGNGAAGEQ